MPLNYLGKMVFPRQQPWERRKNLKTSLIVLAVSISFAAIVGAVIFLRNSRSF